MKRTLSYIGFWVIHCTWGCIMTLIGAITALVMIISGHKPHRIGPNVYFEVGSNWGGVELGPFFLVCKNRSRGTILHECGHGIQGCIWGPLMPFVIGIPSAVRYWYREYLTRVKGVKYWMLPDYDAIWFEGQATRWGEKVYNDLYDKRK